MNKSKKPALLAIGGVALAVLILIIVLLLTRCGGLFPATITSGELQELLEQDGFQTIRLDGDVLLEGPVTVNGSKTIEGEGSIILGTPLEGNWPDANAPTWGMGCADLKVEDATAMGAALTVNGKLTLGGSVKVDAAGNGNGILVQKGGDLKISDDAGILGGRYANLVISKGASAGIAGGQLLEGAVHNVINNGTLDLTGGSVSGAKAGAAVYTAGEMTQSGGLVSGAAFHNVYVAEGSFTMTGGANDMASKDGVLVAKGAKAQVTGGTITNCNHGLCNKGTLDAGAITLNECGIMNYADAKLNIKGTTVDTAEVYCLANNGGTVNAEDFTAIGCDTCAVYNFSGDMYLKNLTVENSRDGNIANANGNMTVDGASLDVCRDKAVTVGNGKAVLNDVTIAGTTGNKYGVYAYGGELEMNNCTIQDISSTAVKVDAGSTVKLNHVDIRNVEQSGFQSDGGTIIAKDVTMESIGSHGIYNNNGEVIADGMTIKNVSKNAVQQKSGTTTLNAVTAEGMGNHGGYVEKGTLTVTDSSFKDMKGNGFYIVSGENKLVLKKVTID